MLKHHTVAGYIILCHYLLDRKNLSAPVARNHHERKDGSGYPSGIQLQDLMIEMIASCDIFDALISSRVYRPVSYDNRTACEEITKMAERGEINRDVVRALIAYKRKDTPHFSDCRISAEKRGTPPPSNVYGIIAEDTDENHSFIF